MLLPPTPLLPETPLLLTPQIPETPLSPTPQLPAATVLVPTSQPQASISPIEVGEFFLHSAKVKGQGGRVPPLNDPSHSATPFHTTITIIIVPNF